MHDLLGIGLVLLTAVMGTLTGYVLGASRRPAGRHAGPRIDEVKPFSAPPPGDDDDDQADDDDPGDVEALHRWLKQLRADAGVTRARAEAAAGSWFYLQRDYPLGGLR